MSKRWHNHTQAAITEVADRWGYVAVRPSKVYIRTRGEQAVHYEPDVLWVRKTYKDRFWVVLWEVENEPSYKGLAGDWALASLCRTTFAEFYPYKECKIGIDLPGTVKIVDTYDKRKKSQILYPNKRLFFAGHHISRLSLIVVFWDKRDSRRFGKYIDVLDRQRWGHKSPFHLLTYFACATDRLTGAARSIGRSISELEGKI